MMIKKMGDAKTIKWTTKVAHNGLSKLKGDD